MDDDEQHPLAHPDPESLPGTVEYEEIREEVEYARRRITVELRDLEDLQQEQQLLIRRDFRYPIKLRLGQDQDTSPCYLLHGSECPQLGAEYILVQPDVVSADPKRGWLPLGGVHPMSLTLGREYSPQLRLGRDVDYSHCSITAMRYSFTDELFPIDVTDVSMNGTFVELHPDDRVVGPE